MFPNPQNAVFAIAFDALLQCIIDNKQKLTNVFQIHIPEAISKLELRTKILALLQFSYQNFIVQIGPNLSLVYVSGG